MKNLDFYLAGKVFLIGILVASLGQTTWEWLALGSGYMALMGIIIIFGTMLWVAYNKCDLLVSFSATCVVILVFIEGSTIHCKENYWEHIAMLAFNGTPIMADSYQAESYEETRKLIYRQSPCGNGIASEIAKFYRNW